MVNVSDTQRLRNQGLSDVEIGKEQNETKYEEDRPPLGWQSTSPKQPHQSMTSSELVSGMSFFLTNATYFLLLSLFLSLSPNVILTLFSNHFPFVKFLSELSLQD